MPEEVFFTEQLHEQVAAYIVEHGGQVETETVGPYEFCRVTIHIAGCNRFGGSDNSPIYKYALVDGGQLLIQFNRSKGPVPGYYEAYWVTIYIQREIMGKTQRYEQKPPETSLQVTTYEVNLISNILYVALNHMQLDEHARKTAQSFIAKLQKAALSISRQPTH